jgi:hypothetical protein
VFVSRRAELDDWEAEERAYHAEADQLEEHDCAALERYGPWRHDGPGRRASGRKPSGRQTVRSYRFTCACDPPFILRCGRLTLEAVCGVCGEAFQREPTESEQRNEGAAA